MDTEERPQKLRKLETPPESEPAVSLLPQPVENVPSSSENSKAQEHAANDADAIVVNSEDSSDVEHDTGIPSEVHDPSSQNGGNAQSMSKNQLKKLRKREAWDAGRDYRKAKRKQKIQERKQRKRDAKEEEQARQQENGGVVESATTTRPYRRSVLLPITIMIDCGFDDLMIEKERISLGSQLTRSYSDNWRAPFQTHLVISSWGGQLGERFDTVLRKYHLNWKGVTFETDGFVEAAQKAHEFMKGPKGGKLAGIFQPVASKSPEAKEKEKEDVEQPQPSTASTSQPSTTPNAMDVSFILSDPTPDVDSAQQQHQPPPSPLPLPSQTSVPTTPSPDSGEIIYLSSDSPDTLSTLRPYSTYIVGGLVDKNRHKGICYRTACEQGIKTAKLPIGEYLDMQSRKVLTTNHVVEIMIRYLECGDWGEAFVKVIPKRKGGKLRDKSADDEVEDGHDDGDDDDDDDVEDDVEDNNGGHEKDDATLGGDQGPNIARADDGDIVISNHVEGLSSSNAEVPAIG